jgi:hypothetical protein
MKEAKTIAIAALCLSAFLVGESCGKHDAKFDAVTITYTSDTGTKRETAAGFSYQAGRVLIRVEPTRKDE